MTLIKRMKRRSILLVIDKEEFHKDMVNGKGDKYTYTTIFAPTDNSDRKPLAYIIRKWSKPR